MRSGNGSGSPLPIGYPRDTSSAVPNPGRRLDSHRIRERLRKATVFGDPRSEHKKRTGEIKLGGHNSSNSGASSHLGSRPESSGKPQGRHPATREKSVTSSETTAMDLHPVMKGAKNVVFPMSVPILVSDFEDAQNARRR